MNQLPAAILFDLDGTLIHSAPDLRAAANHLCRQQGIETFDLETIISFIGNGVPVLVKRIFDARNVNLNDDEYQEAIKVFLDYYDQHSTDMTVPYEGVVEALNWLKGEGVVMAVVTNKPEAPARAILKSLALERYFDVVVGGDTTKSKKPDPKPYLFACEQLAVEPSQSIYIGDSEADSGTAEAANVRFVMYTNGYRNSSVEEINPWRKFDHFIQLKDILCSLAHPR